MSPLQPILEKLDAKKIQQNRPIPDEIYCNQHRPMAVILRLRTLDPIFDGVHFTVGRIMYSTSKITSIACANIW